MKKLLAGVALAVTVASSAAAGQSVDDLLLLQKTTPSKEGRIAYIRIDKSRPIAGSVLFFSDVSAQELEYIMARYAVLRDRIRDKKADAGAISVLRLTESRKHKRRPWIAEVFMQLRGVPVERIEDYGVVRQLRIDLAQCDVGTSTCLTENPR